MPFGNPLSTKAAFDNLEATLTGPLSAYPTLANAVTVTGHAGAWTVGAYAAVVPASTITSEIYIDSIVIEAVSAADSFQVAIATGVPGAEVDIASARFVAGHATNSWSIYIPIRKKVAANLRIAVKSANKAGASAKTCDVSIQYRTIS